MGKKLKVFCRKTVAKFKKKYKLIMSFHRELVVNCLRIRFSSDSVENRMDFCSESTSAGSHSL